MIKQYKLRFYNFRLVVFLLAISFIGIQLVGTAADYLRTRQLLGVIIGVVLMLILSLMDYSWLLNFQWIMYGFNIVMLLAVRFFGSSANGAARWVDLGFIRFQPTELSKIIIIRDIRLIINRLRPEMVARGDMMSVDDVLEILAVDLIGAILDDEQIVISTNQGEPLSGKNSQAEEEYRNICRRLMGEDIPYVTVRRKNSIFQPFGCLFKK